MKLYIVREEVVFSSSIHHGQIYFTQMWFVRPGRQLIQRYENPDLKHLFLCRSKSLWKQTVTENPDSRPESCWFSTLTTFQQQLQSNVIPCVTLDLVEGHVVYLYEPSPGLHTATITPVTQFYQRATIISADKAVHTTLWLPLFIQHKLYILNILAS